MNKPALPVRDPNSHKGKKGKVLIVAGSHKYYGAPIFTALAAEHSGADLITLFLPIQHLETAKNYSLNLFLDSFVQNDLGLKDIGLIIDEASRNHVLIIGNGIGTDGDTKKAIIKILEEVSVPVVLDAEALFPEILTVKRKSAWVLTPHRGEFTRVFDLEPTENNVAAMSKKHNLTILLKSPVDIIATNGNVHLNHTGCPQMRVGGTGDALAGIVGSYISQGLAPHEASISGAYYWGKCGETLAKTQNSFTCLELIKTYSHFIQRVSYS